MSDFSFRHSQLLDQNGLYAQMWRLQNEHMPQPAEQEEGQTEESEAADETKTKIISDETEVNAGKSSFIKTSTPLVQENGDDVDDDDDEEEEEEEEDWDDY